MGTNMKSVDIDDRPSHIYIYSRIAGLVYVALILLAIISYMYIDRHIFVDGDDAATVENIVNNDLRFRISLVSEIVMYAFTVLLAYMLYVILKPVNTDLAFLALLWRIGEAIIGAVVALLAGLVPLLLLNGKSSLQQDQIQGLVGLFMQVRGPGLNIYLIFLGLGGTVFFYLFFISKYIPRTLAAWGMITYFSLLLLAFSHILSLDIPGLLKMLIFRSIQIFEVVIGLWLLIKGVDVKKKELPIATQEQIEIATESQIDAEILD